MIPAFNWNPQKAMEEILHFNESLVKSASQILTISEIETAPTPKELIYEEDKMKLYRYTPKVENPNSVPLLIVYALVNRQYMLDLQSDRSIVNNYLDLGLDVYIIDWGYPDRADRFITMEDYIDGYINEAVDIIRKRSGHDKINLLGVCQGGTFSAIYTALYPEKIRNLVTMVAPFDFSTNDGLLFSWAKHLDIDTLVDTFGVVPGSFMNVTFLMLKPFQLAVDKYIGLMDNADKPNAIKDFLRMEKWVVDSPDQVGETLRKFVKDLYQNNLLIQNKLDIGGRTVNLKNITMPLLNIIAEQDHLVPPAASKPLNDAVASKDHKMIIFQGGHIGLFVSSKSQREVAPEVVNWLKDRSIVDEKGAKAVNLGSQQQNR